MDSQDSGLHYDKNANLFVKAEVFFTELQDVVIIRHYSDCGSGLVVQSLSDYLLLIRLFCFGVRNGLILGVNTFGFLNVPHTQQTCKIQIQIQKVSLFRPTSSDINLFPK